MNRLVLAVAGGRKTQSIVDHCKTAPSGRRILVLTYTQLNQQQISRRLDQLRPLNAQVDVQGWFTFLMGHWTRPYLPLRFADRRLHGLNFDGDPGQFMTGERRFLDDQGRAYKLHLAQLSLDTYTASGGAVLDRLSKLYDEIHIDEVQDLNGYDLEILSTLLRSSIDVHLVGDIRQALLLTNVRDLKNKQYKGVKIMNWFTAQMTAGYLQIEHQATTWRSNSLIARFADTIFPESWQFPATVSANPEATDHDGMFAVATADVDAYVSKYAPLCLRHSVSSASAIGHLPFQNIGTVKGLTADHVLIGPTQKVLDFLRSGTTLADSACCSLYVAVTRARTSVAIVCDNPALLKLPVWTPSR